MRTIAIVTSSRADYGHLYWVLKELALRPEVRMRLMVTGSHLSPEFGHTVDVIEKDGFQIHDRIECLMSSDTDVGMAKTLGLALLSFAERFEVSRPDLLLLIADRYEMLAPASAAMAMRIPIAHIEGGERSEGAIDHVVRNALTMMSHVHFATTKAAMRRIVEMGEEPWRVNHVGAASLDFLHRACRSDFTSGPISTIPASIVSTISYSKRARRLVAITLLSLSFFFFLLDMTRGD